MSSGSTTGCQAEANEIYNSQSTTAAPLASSSANHGLASPGASPGPIELPLHTKSEPELHLTTQPSRRFRLRRRPTDPSLDWVSETSTEPPLSRERRTQYDVEEVLRQVLPRTEGTIKLPEFDAAGSYAQSDDVLNMWHDETARLMEIMKSPEMPLKFESSGFLQGDTEKGYRDASNLAQRVLTANAICLLDNECVNAKHCEQLSNPQKLSGFMEQVTKSQRATVTNAGLEDAGAQQQEVHGLEATYSLISYISTVLTRLITKTSLDRYWHRNAIGKLIRRVTKMKLLLRDLQTSSAVAVSAAQAVLSKMPATGGTQNCSRKSDEEECEDYMRLIETNEKEGTASREETQVAAHCVEQNQFLFGLNSALRDVLMSIRRDALRLNSMDQVISVLIPLATTKPAFLTNFSRFRHVMALDGVTLHDEHDGQSTKKLQPFKTSFHLYTTQLDDAVHDSLLEDDDARKQDVLSLSQALETGHFLHPMLLDTRYESLREFTKLVDGWVVDEMSVTVPCPEYVWRVIAVASLLAGGGLGIGFSVGDRINGVDPSNLATYLWVVAAFIILIAKNMKVKEWAWNDFLRRRVRCCSVSELQSMTGVDAQLIIYKLLHDERRGSVLNIRGPYNSAFLRRANEGFAIDVPISSSTLRRSGLVMLKVATAQGYALIEAAEVAV
ncbi:hypothetical protein DHEL01_v206591 [Diaporthe helianthi]|uniref:Uncharacterized protein n=1 Tax=Diaporthe helianthi TaxID=158607 RepID=A0A2P5HXN7_DIAHE|nr:hypothetical protein DHEL01_v206591 [Diaporthe helianthi]